MLKNWGGHGPLDMPMTPGFLTLVCEPVGLIYVGRECDLKG